MEQCAYYQKKETEDINIINSLFKMMQSRGKSHSTVTQEAHHTHLDILVVKPESAVWHSQGPINGPECVFPTRRKISFSNSRKFHFNS